MNDYYDSVNRVIKDHKQNPVFKFEFSDVKIIRHTFGQFYFDKIFEATDTLFMSKQSYEHNEKSDFKFKFNESTLWKNTHFLNNRYRSLIDKIRLENLKPN